MHRLLRVSLLLAGLSFFPWLAGCGGAGDESAGPLYDVKGIVKLDEKPLANANLDFSPLQGTKGTASFATTDETGSFTLSKRQGTKGIEEGKYKCVITKWGRKDGTPFPRGTPGDVSGAEGMEHVPPQYSDPQQSQLTFDIPKGGKKLEILLSSKEPATATGESAIQPQ